MKQSLSVDDEVALLAGRDLIVDDEQACAEFSASTNYYRFCGRHARYFQRAPHVGDDRFGEGTTIDKCAASTMPHCVLLSASLSPESSCSRARSGQIASVDGGSAQLLNADPIAGGTDMVAVSNTARDDDYKEIDDRCQGFLREIEEETAKQHFTYGELEEDDEDLTKLRGWYDKVRARARARARDRPDAAGHAAAEEALEQCANVLAVFAAAVHAADVPNG
ncbi:Chromate resistance protein ChrB [Microbacterium xylanilyticum]